MPSGTRSYPKPTRKCEASPFRPTSMMKSWRNSRLFGAANPNDGEGQRDLQKGRRSGDCASGSNLRASLRRRKRRRTGALQNLAEARGNHWPCMSAPMIPPAAASPASRWRWLWELENLLVALTLAALMVLPLIEIVGRKVFHGGLSGAAAVQ